MHRPSTGTVTLFQFAGIWDPEPHHNHVTRVLSSPSLPRSDQKSLGRALGYRFTVDAG